MSGGGWRPYSWRFPFHIKVWPLAGALLLTACWPRPLAWRLPIALAAVAALPLLVERPAFACEQYVQWYRHLVGPFDDSTYLPRCLDDLGTDSEAPSGQPVALRRAAIGDRGRSLGLCLWQARRPPPQRLVLFVLACWTSWQLVLVRAPSEHVRADRPLRAGPWFLRSMEKKAPG